MGRVIPVNTALPEARQTHVRGKLATARLMLRLANLFVLMQNQKSLCLVEACHRRYSLATLNL